MWINNYIEKLRARPEGQRERIAVAATAASFLVIFAIWLLSFQETDRGLAEEQNQPVENYLEEMRKNSAAEEQSIEEMIQGLPEEEMMDEYMTESGEAKPDQEMENIQRDEAGGAQSEEVTRDRIQDATDFEKNQKEIPKLP